MSLIIITSAAVIGWRVAPDIDYAYGEPVPMLAVDALGALIVAIGLAAVWIIRCRVALFLILVCLVGAAAGEIARWIWGTFPALGDDLRVLILFC